MKKNLRTFLSVLILSISCFSLTAFAATTYTDILIFQGEHTGSTRSYTGTDMTWSGYTYTEYQNDFMATTFNVSLYRKNFIGASKIGSSTLSRVGHHNVSWTNVGSGDYYFYYTKDRDNANVRSDAITMKMS